MPTVAAYHRPATLDDALALLAQPGRIPLAGGTLVNARADVGANAELVDLQALDLSGIEPDQATGPRLRIGATTTLSALAAHDTVPDWLATLARAEAPSTLRTLATVGGTVATNAPDSVLAAALLVCDLDVERSGPLITAITIDPSGPGAHAATGRTPADVPIVAAVARAAPDGPRLALTGVAPTPILVDPSHPDRLAQQVADLDPQAGQSPPGDFRGSPAYRRHLATVLSARALEALR